MPTCTVQGTDREVESRDGTILDFDTTCMELAPAATRHVCSKWMWQHILPVWQLAKVKSVLDEVGTTWNHMSSWWKQQLHSSCHYTVNHLGHPWNLLTSSCSQSRPTPQNLWHYCLQLPIIYNIVLAHLQVMLWKAAKNQTPPTESADVTQFLREIVDVPTPAMVKLLS